MSARSVIYLTLTLAVLVLFTSGLLSIKKYPNREYAFHGADQFSQLDDYPLGGH